MTNEVASIGVAMETDAIERGIKSLDVLAQQGPKVEKSMAGVESAAAKTGKSIKSLAEGSGKGLDEIGRSAPKAADGVGRVAKSADDAKRALASMDASASAFGSISASSTKAAADMLSFGGGVKSAQQMLKEMQAQVAATNQSVAQMGSVFASAVPQLQAAAKAQLDAAKNAADMGRSLKEAEERVRSYATAAATTGAAAKSFETAASAVRTLNAALAIAGVSFGAKELITMVDGYTKFTAQLKLATKSATDYALSMEAVKRIASDAQQGLGEVGTLYARIANGTAELGLSQRKLADITETVSLSLKVSGATASESSSAMLQLSQAFASGVLRGEEFNSVNEAAPRLMKALADGINVPVGSLRKMAEEGKLTSAVLAEALPKALGKLREESKEVQTIGGAFTVLKNNIMEMVGAQSNASGTTKAFASGINALASNLDLLAAAGGAVAVVLGARFAASITASGMAFATSAVQAARYQAALASMAGVSTTAAAGLVTVGAAARGASAAMALLGGPVGAVLTAVGLAATAFYTFGESSNALLKSIGGLNQPLDDLKRKIDALPPEKRISVIMEIQDDAVKQAKSAEASFIELGNAVTGAFTGMGVVTGATMKEVQSLNDRLREAQRTGEDMTPILREAAKAAGVSNATLRSWLDLAANIRSARDAARAGAQVPDVIGAGGGRGSVNPPTVGEIAASARSQAKAALDATKAFQSQAEQMANVRKEGNTLRAALKALDDSNQGTSASAEQLRERLRGVDERLESMAKRGQKSAAGIKAEENAYASLMASINAKIAANQEELLYGHKLSESDKLRIQLEAQLESGKKKLTIAHQTAAKAALEELKRQEQIMAAAKRNVALYQEQAEAAQQWADDEVKRSKALEAARRAMDAYETSAREEFDRLKLESSLIGKSNQQRAVALAQYDAAIELKRKLAEIDAMDTVNGESDREELRVRARAVYAQKVASAEVKAFNDEWKQSFDQTSQALTDALMRGGKDAGEYLKDYFRTLILRPIIQAIVNPVAAPITSAVQSLLGQGPGGGGVAGGGILGGLQAGQSLWSAFSGGTSGVLASGVMGLGKLMGSSFLGELGAGISAGGQLGLGGTASLISSAGGTTGAGMVIGAAAPWLAGAAALYGLISSLDDSGTPHLGAAARYRNGSSEQYREGMPADAWVDQTYTAISGLATALGKALDSTATAFGKKAGYEIVTAFSDDSSKDGAFGALYVKGPDGKNMVDWAGYDSKWGGRWFSDGEAGYKEYLNAIAVDVKAAFKAMDMPGWADQLLDAAKDLDSLNAALQQIGTVQAVFEQLGQTMTMFAAISGDLQTQLLQTAGSMDALASNAGAFYEGFFSEQERMDALQKQLRESLSGLDLSIDPSMGEAAKEQFRATVEAAMSAGQGELAAKLLALSGSFATAADYAQKAFDDIAKAAQEAAKAASDARLQIAQGMWDAAMANLNAAVEREKSYWQGIESAAQKAVSSLSSTLGLLTSNARELYGTVDSTQQMLAAQGMVYIESALSAVRGGKSVTGFDKLQDAISAARGGITSGAYATQFERDRDALVLAGQLSELGDLTDSQLSVQDRQLKAAQEQISQLDKTLAYWQTALTNDGLQIDATMTVAQAVMALGPLLANLQQAKANSYAGAIAAVSGSAHTSEEKAALYRQMAGSGLSDSQIREQVNKTVGAQTDTDWDFLKKMAGVPGYAVGANYIPNNQLAVLHEGEAVIPKAFNPWAGGQGLNTGANTERLEKLVESLTAEVQRLQSIVNEGNKYSAQTAEILDNVTEGGNAMRSEVMA